MRIKLLGSAAGGGFPQWNCGCANCHGLRLGTLRGKARTQTQVAISGDGKAWFLLNACPDLRAQIESTPELHPYAGARQSPIGGIVLTSGDLDNVLGLLLLREFHPLQVFSTGAIRQIVAHDNSFFRSLERVPGQMTWVEVRPGAAFELKAHGERTCGISCNAIALAGGYPAYVTQGERERLPEDEAAVALVIEDRGGKMLFAPALPVITEQLITLMQQSDVALVDGTFWSDDELQQTCGAGPSARQMGHVPVSGADGSLERLAFLTGPRKIYIHINNTNPMLDDDSPQHKRTRAAGWEIAEDGWEFEL